ncbi:hypothetical protein, partial [Macrococcoides canis]|uniref:hypothetical protein n=1 Tax=Macrococcoides canis TaxID=1855823 RepID=UPI001060BD84
MTIALPTISYDCNAGGSCGANGATVPFYFIEFQVKVHDSSALGSINNRFTVTGGGLVSPATSAAVGIIVSANTSYWLQKEVKPASGGAFSDEATVPAGGNVEYRMTLTIPTATPQLAALRHVSFIDLLPMNKGTDDQHIMT